MKLLDIKEVIIVEGKNDLNKLKSCLNAEIIITNGAHISKETLDLCKKLNDTQGIIVFTDPDGPGEAIRNRIIEHVGTCKHASLALKQAKSKTKVGIEHATCEDIIDAISKVSTFSVDEETLSRSEFFDLGLSGRSDSQSKRDYLSEKLSIPKMSAKRSFKYLNMLKLNFKELDEILREMTNEHNFK